MKIRVCSRGRRSGRWTDGWRRTARRDVFLLVVARYLRALAVLRGSDAAICGPGGIQCSPGTAKPRRTKAKKINALPVPLPRQVLGVSFFALFFVAFSVWFLAAFWKAFGGIFGAIFDQFSILVSIKKVVGFSIDFPSIFWWILGA